ncbi:hypothetical protein [Natrarchaeobaculum aegyptiacum]|uniref:hypothetical protein n=1 Tax=Natrarchaeobaculum aegyptiacum TaxID=745377 RepID=UPI0012602901|nr:hypothetical protein [Natrarchaeobaculum aegyptiacum]
MTSDANGIRNVDLSITDTEDSFVEIEFGPHHRVRIEEKGDDVMFSLVATHHGFKASANDELPTSLEEAIRSVRDAHPELTID